MPRAFPKSYVRRVLNLYYKGYSYEKIAELVHSTNTWSIRNLIFRHKEYTRASYMNKKLAKMPTKSDDIVKLLKSTNLSAQKIAEKLGTTREYVYVVSHKYNLSVRRDTKRQQIIKSLRDPSLTLHDIAKNLKCSLNYVRVVASEFADP